jgi:hypothetical protein
MYCGPYFAGVLHSVSDLIRSLQNCFTAPNKMTSEDDIKGLVSLKFLRPWLLRIVRPVTKTKVWGGGGKDQKTARHSCAIQTVIPTNLIHLSADSDTTNSSVSPSNRPGGVPAAFKGTPAFLISLPWHPVLKFLNNLRGLGTRVGIGLSYRAARLHRLAEFLGINSWDPGF